MEEEKKFTCASCGAEVAEMPEGGKCGCGGDVKMQCKCENGSHSENCCSV